jgi:hypothetical protein
MLGAVAVVKHFPVCKIRVTSKMGVGNSVIFIQLPFPAMRGQACVALTFTLQ